MSWSVTEARGCIIELEIALQLNNSYSGVSGKNNLVHTMPWQVHVAIVKMTILS